MRTSFARKQYDEGVGSLPSYTPKAELTGKLVYMFLTGMVKDKVGYTVREICKNAWEVGAFEVTLPTPHSPNFVVRDYGPGLDHEFMTQSYAKLGFSTKDDNGVDGVSGFGAGSKSPLAYLFEDGMSGAYSVESVHGGMKRFYAINLDETGYPQVTPMGEMESDEPTGLTVSVPVRKSDIYTFERRARAILWSFEPRPKIMPEIAFEELVIAASGNGWTLYKPRTVPFSGPQVRMGPVMYPFDLAALETHSGFLDANDPVVFDVDPALVEVTSSRESLQYTSATKTTLTNLAKTFEISYAASIQEKVSAATTWFAACQAFWDATATLSSHRSRQLQPRVLWRGLPILNHLGDIPMSCAASFMTLYSGWNVFEKFKGEPKIAPESLVGAKVVIENNPYRSLLRFERLGLIGQHVLWIRVKKEDQDALLAGMGLTMDDVVCLDTAKITVDAAIKRPKTVRVRRILGADGEARRSEVDMAVPHIFTWRIGSGSYRGCYNMGQSRRNLKSWSIVNFVKQMKEAGVIDEFPEVVVLNSEDEPGAEWVNLGAWLESRLREHLDVEALDFTPPESVGDLPGEMRQMKHYDFSKAPAEISSTIVDMKALMARIEANEMRERSKDKNMTVHNLLATLVIGDVVKEKKRRQSASRMLGERWEMICRKHPILSLIADNCNSYWGAEERTRARLNEYFDLIALKAQIEQANQEDTHVPA